MNRSESIGKLVEAKAKARKAFKPVTKNAENPYFHSSYADLAEIIAATADALSDNGLDVMQSPGWFRDGHVFVTTLLAHSSGEWISDEISLPVSKQDAQGCGSAITYARRYAYGAILNVSAEKDDDGEKAVNSHKPTAEEYEEKFIQRAESEERIKQFQIKGLEDAMKKTGKTEAQVASHLKTLDPEYRQFEQVRKSHFSELLKWMLQPIEIPADLTEKLQESLNIAQEPTTPRPLADGRSIKMKRMFAIAKKKGIPEADLRTMAREIYGKEHFTELVIPEIEAITEWADQQTVAE